MDVKTVLPTRIQDPSMEVFSIDGSQSAAVTDPISKGGGELGRLVSDCGSPKLQY